MTTATDKWVVGNPVAYPARRGPSYVETTIEAVNKTQARLANGERFMLETGKLVGTNEFRYVWDMTIEKNISRVAASVAAKQVVEQREDRRRRLAILIQDMGQPRRFEKLSDAQLVAMADAIETVLGQVDQNATEAS